jgi:signal transduction histidine kinase
MSRLHRRTDVFRGGDEVAGGQNHAAILRKVLRQALKERLVVGVAILLFSAHASWGAVNSNTTSVVKLQRTVFKQTNMVCSFELQGVVCALVRERGFLVLQDKTGTLLLELPDIDDEIHAGDSITLAGTNCLIARDRFGIQVRTPVIDNDGLHSATLKTGAVFLNSGFQPIHLEWFNRLYERSLTLEYSGPGLPRQAVPANVLWRKPQAKALPGNFRAGLNYAAYNDDWTVLPDFGSLEPAATGVATNFNLGYSAQNENTALVFDGFIKIGAPGEYTFYLASDDGSRLEVGPPAISCSIVKGSPRSVPVCKTFEQALAGQEYHQWVEMEGEVVFAAENQHSMEMELIERGTRVPVTVVEDAGLNPINLLHQHVRIKGICEFSRNAPERELVGLFVPGAAQVEIPPPPGTIVRNFSSNDLLTTCAEIRRLKPEEAGRGIPARIKGVVIAADPLLSMVLEDPSGGVFIHLNWSLLSPNSRVLPDTIHTNASTGFFVHVTPRPGISFDPLPPDGSVPPAVGQLWEIEGRTDPGDFSPVIFATNAVFLGQVAMPESIQPTWDQLMNGSLDAEYVEIHGVVVSISTNEMTLLMPNGKVAIEGGSGPLGSGRPLPSFPGFTPASLIGSVVRIRGCFTADWDFQSRQVIPGRFYLSPAITEVEEPALPDPFSIAVSKASDLLSFNARATAMQRVKVVGQIIHVRSGEFCMLDGRTGARVLGSDLPSLRPGDIVEAVGFLRHGGPSPVLQQAQTRKVGRAPLPEPVPLSETNMLARGHDSTLVRVEGTLINDIVHPNDRLLELQNGVYHFAAVLKVSQRTRLAYSIGSRLQLTGVYVSESPGLSESTLYPFEILLNNTTGIVVLQRPAWWTVRGALTVAAVLAGILGIAFIWISLLRRKIEQRTRQLQQEIETRQLAEQHRFMEQERIRVARDLHDELGTGLTEVGILGALAKNPAIDTREREQYLAQLTESAGTLVTALDEIVWAVNPQYDSLASLASYYSLFAQRFLNLAGIACRLSATESLPEYPLNSKTRHGIFLAFKEALNNVVRHSGATEVEIKFELVKNELAISIRDNGKGLAGNPVSGNDGLSGMRERLRQFGGECRIDGNSGRGTLVEFRLSLNGASS